MTGSRLVNRNVVAGRGRTSMRLEPELWNALQEICERECQDISQLVRQVEAAGHEGGRTSAVRVFIVEYLRAAAGAPGCDHGAVSDAHGDVRNLAARNGTDGLIA